MIGLDTNAGEINTQLQINQDGVGSTHELLQIREDVILVEVTDVPSASPRQDVAVDLSNSVNNGEELTASSGDLESDLVAEEQEKSNLHELTRTKEDTFLSLAEDILPIRLNVDAGDRGTHKKARSSPVESKSVSKEDNAVVQKVLQRRWRYFDYGDLNVYLEGYAVNSAAQNRRKPCYVCADLQHSGKKCRKRRTCFTCNGKGHIAEDCPKSNKIYDICLRCGEPGHDLFSCSNDYSSDDLKKIQCYICNEVGHLCCDSYNDQNPATVSCCNCGESVHSGLECPKPRLEKGNSKPPSICYKCGEQGHVGRNCTISKAGGRDQNSIQNPEGAVLNPVTSQLGQDGSAMPDLSAETNDTSMRQSRKARKNKAYKARYSRGKKLKVGLIDSIAE